MPMRLTTSRARAQLRVLCAAAWTAAVALPASATTSLVREVRADAEVLIYRGALEDFNTIASDNSAGFARNPLLITGSTLAIASPDLSFERAEVTNEVTGQWDSAESGMFAYDLAWDIEVFTGVVFGSSPPNSWTYGFIAATMASSTSAALEACRARPPEHPTKTG